MTHFSESEYRQTTRVLIGVAALWLVALYAAVETGWLASIYRPLIAVIIALTIILPRTFYLLSARLQAYAAKLGHRKIIAFHIWRIPAALTFFWYGAHGLLPPAFWILAGVGDFIAGVVAYLTLKQPESKERYLRFHRIGFADFIVAVGTGLTFTLLLDPRMAPVIQFPLALIPLFGVGISSTTHLIAFHMLRKKSAISLNHLKTT